MNETSGIKIKRIILVGGGAILFMLLLSAYAWMQIPAGEKLPVHWGIDGQPDRYGSKFEGLLLMPLICIGLTGLFCGIPYIEPRKFNLESSQKAYFAIVIGLFLFLSGMHVVTILAALGRSIDMNLVVPIALGVLFVLIGNFMGKIRSNFFCGIRTPWTLSSELSWNKTHRLGGKLFIALGVLMAASALFKTNGFPVWLVLGGSLTMCAVLFIYSYVIWKNDPQKKQSGR